MSQSISDLAAGHAGITNAQARQAVASALRSVHRIALTDHMGLTAVALEMRLEFGSEATYHLFGLLELERRSEFHD